MVGWDFCQGVLQRFYRGESSYDLLNYEENIFSDLYNLHLYAEASFMWGFYFYLMKRMAMRRTMKMRRRMRIIIMRTRQMRRAKPARSGAQTGEEKS